MLALSLGKGLNTIVNLGLGVAAARLLTTDELATYRQTLLAYTVVIPLLGLGLSQGIYYFLPVARERVRGIFVDGVCLLAGLGLLYALGLMLGGNQLLADRFSNPALAETLLYLAPLPIIALPATLVAAVLVTRDRVKILTVFNVLSQSGIGAGVLLACLIWSGPTPMVISRVALSAIAALIGLGLALRSLPADDWWPNRESIGQMVRYSFPLGLAGMIGTISLQLDKIVVSAMQSPERFAIYSVGAIEVPLIGIITASVASVMMPDLRRAVEAGDHTRAIRLFRRATEKSLWVMLPAMLFLFACADIFIVSLFSEKYAESAISFRIYLLFLPVRTIFAGPLLMVIGKSKLILYRAAVALFMNGTLSVLLVSYFGYLGAPAATIITAYLWSTPFNFIMITRHFQVPMGDLLPLRTFWRLLLIFALPALCTFLVTEYLWVDLALLQFSVSGLIFAGVFLYAGRGVVYHPAQIKRVLMRILRG